MSVPSTSSLSNWKTAFPGFKVFTFCLTDILRDSEIHQVTITAVHGSTNTDLSNKYMTANFENSYKCKKFSLQETFVCIKLQWWTRKWSWTWPIPKSFQLICFSLWNFNTLMLNITKKKHLLTDYECMMFSLYWCNGGITVHNILLCRSVM